MFKIIVNGKTFRKWNTANKQAKKDKDVKIKIEFKSREGKRYHNVVNCELKSEGDLKKEIEEYLNKEYEKIHQKALDYLKNDDIGSANFCVLMKRDIMGTLGRLDRIQ